MEQVTAEAKVLKEEPLTPFRTLGYEPLDSQHKEIYDQSLLLYETVKINSDNNEYHFEIFSKMLDCIIAHFATEERLMYRSKFPNYDEHKADHDKMIQVLTLITYKLEMKQCVLSPVLILINFISNTHLDIFDVPLVNWCKEKSFFMI